MSEVNKCTNCGAELPSDAPKGFCPRCLYRLGFDEHLPANGESQPGQAGAATELAGTLGSLELRSIGDYELLEELGHGGMGVVYKARQKSLDRIVALKLLLFGPYTPSESVKRFRAEAVATAALQHPNIVAIHEVGYSQGQHFIAMDYVEGQSLSALIRGSPLPARRAAGYVKTIAQAIHYAHECGILHRDLKPANVLLDTHDQPRVTDFGLAKRLGHDPELTATDQVLGSPNFMPPEQATRKRGALTRRSDVYALGAILYHALTGRPPFVGESPADIMQEVLNVEPISPRVLNPSVPADLKTVCLKCLEKDPGKRYATAQLLAEELGRFLEGKPVLARPVGRLGKAWRWCRRNPVRAGLIALVIAVFALGTIGVLWQWQRAEQARRDAVEKFWQSCLAQAQANRWSGRAGRRFAGLEAIRQAAVIRPTLELRNEAIACLALPDARVQSRLPSAPQARLVGLAFDGDSERYARAYEDSSVTICSARDHSELLKLPARGHTERCGLLFSPHGQFLAQCPNDQTAKAPFAVWDLSRGRLLFTVPFAVRSFCFTPDEQQIALAESAGRIHFYELATATEVGSLTIAPGINHIALDPAGQRLAVAQLQGPSVVILDLKSQSITGSLTNAGLVGFIAWSPDGSCLVCPSSDERVYLWNVATGDRKALEGHTSVVTGALFNRLGDVMVSFGWDFVTWFWDPKLGLPLVSLGGSWLQNGFDPSDQRLGFGVGGLDTEEYGIWEVAPARECRRLGRTAPLREGAFTADGRVLATSGNDGVRLWHVPLNRLLARLPVDDAGSVNWHPNGTNLISSGPSGIQLWPVAFSRDATEVRVGPARQLAAQGRAHARLAADGRFLVATEADNADVLTLDLVATNQPRLLTGHLRAMNVSISPDGKWFATGTWHGTGVKIWSTQTWQPVKELAVKGSARCVFSSDGRWLCTGPAAEYCFWEVGSWEPRLRITRDRAGDMHGAIALSPDGRLAALLHGRNRAVKLISLPDGRELATLDTGEPLCFSADGSQLATAGDDHRTLLVWDLRLIRHQLRALKLDWD